MGGGGGVLSDVVSLSLVCKPSECLTRYKQHVMFQSDRKIIC